MTVWFNLTVFDQNMHVVNPFPICNAGAVSEKIISVDYICAKSKRYLRNLHSTVAVVAGVTN